MLRTAAKYFASSGFNALLDLLMCPVINSESDLIDNLHAPRALAFRRPKSKPSYSATLFVHPLKSSLTAYFSCVPEGAVRTAEAPAPSLWYAPSHSSCHIVSNFGGSCEGVAGVQTAMNSAKTWDLIVVLGTKSIVCSASFVAHLPILRLLCSQTCCEEEKKLRLLSCDFENNIEASAKP